MNELLETMCRRCVNHEQCLGTGCNPKNKLAEALEELQTLRKALILACQELSKRDNDTGEHVSLVRSLRYKQKFLKKGQDEDE